MRLAAYMDVIRDRQVAVLRERNLEFLVEQVRAANSRFEVGEGTRTDVAQAEASRSSAVAQLAAARAQVTSSEAIYTQIVGEQPGSLSPAPHLPNSCRRASIRRSLRLAQGTLRFWRQSIWSMPLLSRSSQRKAHLLPQLSASAGISTDHS